MIFLYKIIDKYINFNIISFKISININNNIYNVYYINYTGIRSYNFKLYNVVLFIFIVFKKTKKKQRQHKSTTLVTILLIIL